jgi:hypothetical protein
MHSCMVIFRRKCTCRFHLTLVHVKLMGRSLGWESHYMGLNNLHEHGLIDSGALVWYGIYPVQWRSHCVLPAFWEAHHDSCTICGWYHYYGDYTFELSHLKQKLSKEFEVQDLGQLSYFLGIEIARSPKGIVFSQWKHVFDLLGDVGSAWVSSCFNSYIEQKSSIVCIV